VVSAEAGEPTVRAQIEARQADLKIGVRADPLVQAVLARFPGAEIVDVRTARSAATPMPGPPLDAVALYGGDWPMDGADDADAADADA
jgi:DNA polymerase-3 subunit gamma/tau